MVSMTGDGVTTAIDLGVGDIIDFDSLVVGREGGVWRVDPESIMAINKETGVAVARYTGGIKCILARLFEALKEIAFN